jgi:maltooligosyltrehalose trehalohydrolase
MLFMGEEWGSSQPFPFFCDFDGELAELIRNGRRQEFANFPEFQDPQQRERIPDPLAEATFQSAKLDWAQSKEEVHAEWLEWYRRILEVRKRFVTPQVREMGGHSGRFEVLGAGAVVVRFWNADSSRQLVLAANLSDESRDGFPCPAGQILWHERPEPTGTIMRPWSVCWTLQGSVQREAKETS